MALLFANFWSQFLTDFHKWPFILKLRTWSFRCTYCHDPIIVIMGLKMFDNFDSCNSVATNLTVLVAKCCNKLYSSTKHVDVLSLLPACEQNSHETNSFHFLYWIKNYHLTTIDVIICHWNQAVNHASSAASTCSKNNLLVSFLLCQFKLLAYFYLFSELLVIHYICCLSFYDSSILTIFESFRKKVQ